ncbi:MAG: (Na+)-NQR maturation NqrM [Gammaproteobacteria bacterium]|uniref:(Na+)-NQR maturation NqrM n=1 Tax=Pseudomaricurvus alcaniphilus TaxID=1166482 RepID=UPI001409D2F4|nr:(Na+)-NQR maturation NqrM [Pseudomaricurvus alcaniphilus]MBR9911485.1 (Na+)-NQR maturation NqrM [Gammaproteobacteria bacterium]NHN35950.1 (Na+)-NQR maturation NqrM [Pseudomaricurvus alcaniphilus]
MKIFLLTLLVLLLFVVAMAVGVLMGRKPLKGSCGGVGAALGEEDYVCDLCGGDPNKCDEQQESTPAAKELAYEAATPRR